MKRYLPILVLIQLSVLLSCGPRSASNDTPSTTDTVIADNRNNPDFKVFLPTFLSECYFQHNIDSLVYSNSPVVTKFIHKELGIERYYNPGTFCVRFDKENGYGYIVPANGNWGGSNKIQLSNYYTTEPVDGFCEESSSPDGIYYTSVKEFPPVPDPETGKLTPTTLLNDKGVWSKMKVIILSKHWIVKEMYFVQIGSIWYLVYIKDCDCSA